MKKNLQDIDKLFKDALEEHLEPAPSGVWDAVNNDLDKKQAFLFKEKYFRLKKLALVALLFIFSGIAYLLYFVKPANNKETGITQKPLNADKEKGSAVINSPAKKTVPATLDVRVKEEQASKETPANEISETKEPVVSSSGASANKHIEKAQHTNGMKEDVAGENKIKLSWPPAGETANKESIAAGGPVNINASGKKLLSGKTAANTNNLPVANEEGANANRMQATNMQQLHNSFKERLAVNAYNKKGRLAPKYAGANHDLLHGNSNLETITGANDNSNTPSARINERSAVSPLVAYLYQPPLQLTAADYSTTPASFEPAGARPFLKRIQQSDSLQKALAASRKRAAYKPAFSLMVFGSPNHSFTRLENDEQHADPRQNKNVSEREEHQGTSYSAGVLVNYSIQKSLVLQSGIVFSSARTNISPKIIYARPDNNGHARYEFNCSSGYAYISPKTGPAPAAGDSIQVMGSSSSISYIGVPLSLNYVWQRGRFLLKPGVGISVNFLTGGSSMTAFGNTAGDQKETNTITGLKTAYADASVGIGAELMLNRKIAIGIRPLLRMALTSINKETPVKNYQNYLSFETGLKINL